MPMQCPGSPGKTSSPIQIARPRNSSSRSSRCTTRPRSSASWSRHINPFQAPARKRDELFSQSKAVFTLDEVEAKKFSKRIAFNVIPHIDVFMEDGYTKEEWKMVV